MRTRLIAPLLFLLALLFSLPAQAQLACSDPCTCARRLHPDHRKRCRNNCCNRRDTSCGRGQDDLHLRFFNSGECDGGGYGKCHRSGHHQRAHEFHAMDSSAGLRIGIVEPPIEPPCIAASAINTAIVVTSGCSQGWWRGLGHCLGLLPLAVRCPASPSVARSRHRSGDPRDAPCSRFPAAVSQRRLGASPRNAVHLSGDGRYRIGAGDRRQYVTQVDAFYNSSDTAKIAVCPTISRTSTPTITCTVNGPGSITLLPYQSYRVDGVGGVPQVNSAWNAIASAGASALTIFEWE